MGNASPKPSSVLQQEIETVKAEIVALEAVLGPARAEFDQLRAHSSRKAGPNPYRFDELNELISGTGAKLEHLLRHVLPALEKRLHFNLKAEGADADIRDAKCLRDAALAEGQSIAARRDQVQAKLDAIEGDLEAATARANEAEHTAAEAYARAVAEGDEAAQEMTEADFRAAQEARVAAQQHAQRKQVVIIALESEAEKLTAAKRTSDEQAAEATVKLSTALEAKYAARWDDTVEQLAALGAKIGRARRMRGETLYGAFHDLQVVRFTPAVGALVRGTIEDLVDETFLKEAE